MSTPREQILKINPPDEIEKLCQQGQAHLDTERFGEASEAFNQALELDARHPKALFGRALSLRKLREYQAAQRVLNRALYLYPMDLPLLMEQGHLYFDQEQYSKAAEAFDRTLAVSQTYEEALVWKIRSLRRQGLPYDRTEKVLTEALAKFPQNAAILSERAWLFYAKQKYDEAVEAFISAGGEEALENTIASLLKSGELNEVEPLIDAALDRLPKNLRILEASADFYDGRGQYEKSVEMNDRILSLYPNNERALEKKIRSLCAQGPPYDRVENILAAALAKFPQNAAILSERAWLFYVEQKYDEAVEAFINAGGEEALTITSLLESGERNKAEPLIDAALDRLPKNLRILEASADFYDGRRQYEKSVEMNDRILSLHPNNEKALVKKIRSLRTQGPPYDRVENALAEALARFPQNGEILSERAELFYDRKDYDSAVEAFIEAQNKDNLRGKIYDLRVQRKFSECRQLVDSALRRLPNDIRILNQRGWLYYDQTRYKQATEAFDQALAVEPSNEDALRWRSTSLRLQGRFADAEAAIKEGLGRLPKSGSLLNERGWVYYYQARYDQAIEAFDQTLAIEPENEDALLWKIRALRAKRSFTETDKAIDESLARVPESAQILFERGKSHYDRDEYEKADEYYSKAIAIKADYLEPYFSRVDVLNRLNRSDEALELLQQLRRSRPDDLEVRTQLGWFYLVRNDLTSAKKEFEAVLGTDPTSTTGINSIGAVYFNLGQYDRAEEQFSRALKMEPSEAVFHNNLAWALVRQVKEASPFSDLHRQSATWLERLKRAVGNLEESGKQTATECLREAEDHCRAALQIDPNYASSYGCLGVIAFKRGKLLDSEDFFQTSVRLNPKEGSYVDLGALYVQMGRYEEAGKVLEKARQIDRNDARIRLELGNLYLQTDRPKDATRMFREAMAVNPQGEDAPRALAISLMRAGEYTEAGRVLRKAIREMEEPKRWLLHLTLCQLLTELGDKNSDPDLYEEALKEVLTATALRPEHPAPYFYAGIVRYKREEYPLALRSFRKCLEKDPNHFEAEQNARRVEALRRRDLVRTRGGQIFGAGLGIACLGLLVGLWILYFNTTNRITSTMLNTLSPILLGLVFIGFLLPWLTRLKLPGVEADLSQPKEKISAGPTGSVGFGSSSLSSGPQ